MSSCALILAIMIRPVVLVRDEDDMHLSLMEANEKNEQDFERFIGSRHVDGNNQPRDAKGDAEGLLEDEALRDTFSVLTWNVLSIGLRSSFFDVDPAVYSETLGKLQKQNPSSLLWLEDPKNHIKGLQPLLAEAIPESEQQSEFLFYALFTRNAKRTVGDHTIFSEAKKADADPEKTTMDKLLGSPIEKPAYLKGVFPVQNFFKAKDQTKGLTWSDCLGLDSDADPLFGTRLREDSGAKSRWATWKDWSVPEWLREDRVIYLNSTTKPLSLSQGAKFFPKRGLNAWTYDSTSGNDEATKVLQKAAELCGHDFLKLRIYDLLMLKAWYDAAVEADEVWQKMGEEELPVLEVWGRLKRPGAGYQVDAETHWAELFQVVRKELHSPDIVLLQEVDETCLRDRALLCAESVLPIVAGEEAQLNAVLLEPSGSSPFSELLASVCPDVAPGLLASSFPYVAFYGSTDTKDPDNSVILVKTMLLREVHSIENVSTRILRVEAALAVPSASSSQPITVELGSYHFSSGHAETTKEFADHIFGRQPRQFAILGGDLNTEPEKIQEGAQQSGQPMKRLTDLASEAIPYSTYAKTLSLLQPQMTKAGKTEQQNIDHIYGWGFKRAVPSMPQQDPIKEAYEAAAERAGYKHPTQIGFQGVFGLLPKSEPMHLPLFGQPFFQSD